MFGIDVKEIVVAVGLWGVWSFVFAESSIIFFLPGDSLLFVGGLLASQGNFSVWLLFIGTLICAVAGNSLGYFIGQKMGQKLFKKESLLFKQEYADKANAFYDRYGAFTVVIARFIPFVRTFAPIIAGIGKMNYKIFVTYNFIGGLFWSALMIFGGYYLGKAIPNIDKYILPIVIGIVVVSVLPGIVSLLKKYFR